MSKYTRPSLALLAAALLVSPAPSFAYVTPLSEQDVREAYFLGQNRDESMARLLNRYTKVLPPPDTGPYIASITFLTPFALLVEYSAQQLNYSAPQAAKDHHSDEEIVAIQIEVWLTDSYGALIPTPAGSESGSPVGYQFRSPDFWKDLKIQVMDGEKKLSADGLIGEPTYRCAHEGGCVLTGANLRLEFSANTFASDSATIEVTPPQGDPISVEFTLSSLR